MITSKGLRPVSNAAIGDVVTRSGETVSCSRLVWVLQVGGGRNNNNLEHSLKLEYTDFDAVLPTQVGAFNGATWIYRSTSHSGSQRFQWRLLCRNLRTVLLDHLKSLLFASIRGSTLAVFCGLMLASFSHKWLCVSINCLCLAILHLNQGHDHSPL